MSEFTISATSKSKARLVENLLNVKHFIVGQDYEIYFTVTNISEEESTPGRCFIIITWPGTKASTTWDFHIGSLEPHIPEVSETRTYTALSTGLALISLNQIKSGQSGYEEYRDGKLNFVRKRDGKELKTTEAFDSIFATTPEAIYEYWALGLAAIGLFLADWSLYHFLCLSALGLIFLAKINRSKTQKLQLIFSLAVSGYSGQFSYLMSILRVIEDTIRAGYLRSLPYISEYDRIYGIKWGVHSVLRTPIQYHILMIAAITFMIWSFCKVARDTCAEDAKL